MSVKSDKPKLGWGITGFGLAHILLGTVDLMSENNKFETNNSPDEFPHNPQ